MPHYLGFDIKTTGQSMSQHCIVAIGACLVDVRKYSVVSPREEHTFRVVLKIPEIGHQSWEPSCFADFWTKKLPENNGSTPLALLHSLAAKYGEEDAASAMQRLWTWIRAMYAKYPDTRIITDTVAYDGGWINHYFAKYLDTPCQFHTLEYVSGKHVALRCVTGYYMGMVHFLMTTSGKGACDQILDCMLAYGNYPTTGEFPARITDVVHDHDPVNDAEVMTLKAAYITSLMLGFREGDDGPCW